MEWIRMTEASMVPICSYGNIPGTTEVSENSVNLVFSLVAQLALICYKSNKAEEFDKNKSYSLIVWLKLMCRQTNLTHFFHTY
jgi:hypothetical protein